MLTSDHLRLRRRGEELVLDETGGAKPARAEELAEAMRLALHTCVGKPLSEINEAFAAIDVAPKEEKLKAGFAKLLLDQSQVDEIDGEELERRRREVFLRSAKARTEGVFVRARVLDESALTLGVAPEVLDRELYGDLRDRQHLLHPAPISAKGLVAEYRSQAVAAPLLRAESVRARFHAPSPLGLRLLFTKLKFHKLLFQAERADHDIILTLDGPMSLFGAGPKYGLALVLAQRTFSECGAWSLEARVRHGTHRGLLYSASSASGAPGARKTLATAPVPGMSAATASERPKRARPSAATRPLKTSDTEPVYATSEVRALADKLRAIAGIVVDERATVLDIPGLGLVIPDFSVSRGKLRMHVEVLGFWSRDAVWKRVELVAAGLTEPVVFCVSERLRVSQEALSEDAPGALYVFKGTPRASALLERIERLWMRSEGGGAKPVAQPKP